MAAHLILLRKNFYRFNLLTTMLLKKIGPLAIALILTAAAPAATISDNLNAATFFTEVVNSSSSIAAGFQTDNTSYTLTSVTVLMSQNTPGSLNLSLYSNAPQSPPNDLGFQPGVLLGNLTSPGGYPSMLSQVTFGGNNLPLAPDTTYWLVMTAPSGGAYEWAYAAGNDGSGVGFYPSWGVRTSPGTTWYTSDLQPMQMRVMADPAVNVIPEPAVSSLLLAGLALCGFNRLRSRR